MSVKTCSKCKAEFGCNATGSGCWCEQYTIPQDTLATLRQTYADCLCPNCLQQYEHSQNNSGEAVTNQ